MADKILHIDNLLVDNIVTHWRKGGLVGLPTETVYGLAADAMNGKAVASIYALKSRPQFNPLIIHVADAVTAQRYVEWNAWAEALARAYWSGPLTMVLKKKPAIAAPHGAVHELVSAGGDTLAVRVPAHPVALQLLRAFDGPIAAPSANRSGRVSPTTAAHVREEFGDDLPLVVEGGACEVGLESTVIDLSGEAPVILRPGAVTAAMIEKVTGGRWQVAGVTASSEIGQLPVKNHAIGATGHESPVTCHTLKSPGMLSSHYAPSIPVRMNAREVLADEALLAFGPAPLLGAGQVCNLSPGGDLVEAAANLFASLRALDHPRWRAIAVMSIPNEGIGIAINDRLTRASAPR